MKSAFAFRTRREQDHFLQVNWTRHPMLWSPPIPRHSTTLSSVHPSFHLLTNLHSFGPPLATTSTSKCWGLLLSDSYRVHCLLWEHRKVGHISVAFQRSSARLEKWFNAVSLITHIKAGFPPPDPFCRYEERLCPFY